MQSARDDLDDIVTLPVDVTRVVSIVPSSTESIAVTHASLIVGATDYRTHPADLGVVRVRGTKNPDLERIRGLAPDVVLANAEENRAVDLDALRASGIAVWVTAPTTRRRITRLTRLTRTHAVRDHRRRAGLVG